MKVLLLMHNYTCVYEDIELAFKKITSFYWFSSVYRPRLV